MKKLLFIVLAMICTLSVLAQEKTEKQLILKNGTRLTGIVEIQQDGSYRLESATGDVFFFLPSEVSKVSDVQAVKRNDNYTPSASSVYVKKGTLRFTSTGEALTKNDFASFEAWDVYNSGRRMRKFGNAALWGGIGLAASSLVYASTTPDYESSMLLGNTGSALLIAGVVLKCVGNHKIKSIAKKYNQQPDYSLDFGAQQYGIGFALKF